MTERRRAALKKGGGSEEEEEEGSKVELARGRIEGAKEVLYPPWIDRLPARLEYSRMPEWSATTTNVHFPPCGPQGGVYSKGTLYCHWHAAPEKIFYLQRLRNVLCDSDMRRFQFLRFSLTDICFLLEDCTESLLKLYQSCLHGDILLFNRRGGGEIFASAWLSGFHLQRNV